MSELDPKHLLKSQHLFVTVQIAFVIVRIALVTVQIALVIARIAPIVNSKMSKIGVNDVNICHR